ncbi:hypothetical protein [Paenarthrobacter sp. YJN-5]|uniref:hypothetical protein n=1 Tax=Paenarthrobacter sp. YJN-5 TaxID=2735316 RepID=UPI00187785F3|nr:hypothetical protein [Paenarthrobacter sp. YJN-5]QOT19310.1 hypothetical protein HMI59_21880 [Paenarthrobacter sp. YJN-5]
MKKLASLALTAGALALTVGCSAPAAAPPSVEPNPSNTADPHFGSAATDGPKPNKTLWDYQKPVMKEKAFYAEARKDTTTLDSIENDKLTVIAQLSCATVANGETGKDALLQQALTAATGSTDAMTPEAAKDLTSLLTVGAKNYCADLNAEFSKILA